MYSKMQMIGSVLLALTYPGGGGEAALFRGSASVPGLIYEADRQTVTLPLTMMFVSSALNALVVIPKTVNIMWKVHVGTLIETGSGPDAWYLEDYADDEDQKPLVSSRLVVGKQDCRRKKTRSSLVCDSMSILKCTDKQERIR